MKPLTIHEHVAMRFHDLGIQLEWFMKQAELNEEFREWMESFMAGKSVMVYNSAQGELNFKKVISPK